MNEYWTNEQGFSIANFVNKTTPNAQFAIAGLISQRIKKENPNESDKWVDSLKLVGKIQELLHTAQPKGNNSHQLIEKVVKALEEDPLFTLVKADERQALVTNMFSSLLACR